MSMDLNFWRYQAGAVHDDELVYQRACCDGDALIDLMGDFGCPLYDPQVSTRFDGWTDR